MRILFLGTPEVAAIALEVLATAPNIELVGIITQPDRPAGRGRSLQPPPVKQRAEDLGLDLPILQPETLRSAAAVEWISQRQADLGVVAAYGEILRRNLLRIPAFGYLNIHPSLLPHYRGPAPVNAAILHGDKETGVSVIRLSAKMDAGPILAQQKRQLHGDERTGPLTAELFRVGAELLVSILPAYQRGEQPLQEQDEALVSVTTMIQKQDGVIDWRQPAVQIERMIRAYDPWPGTQTSLRGQPIRILAAQPQPEVVGTPGSLHDNNAGLLVATGQGALELLQVQPAGKRPMSAIEWRRGLHDLNGIEFGT